MRWQFAGLPWELLGSRPAMVTLTYPGEWRPWVPDARTFVAHRKRLQERWRRAFGDPIGVWVVEFQPRHRRPERQRNAPHLHLYVGLPECVSDEEYRGLVARKLRREWMQRRFGAYRGRGKVGPIEGEFSDWLLRSWWEIVGSDSAYHRRRGVDIAPAFGNREVAARADRAQVADYFWRESGKWAQKSPPEEFGSLGFYNRWGSNRGFNPRIAHADMDEQEWVELRRMVIRLAAGKQRATALRQGLKPRKFRGPRGWNGVTAFDVSNAPSVLAQLARCAQEIAVWKAAGGLPSPIESDRALLRRARRRMRLLTRQEVVFLGEWTGEEMDRELRIEQMIAEREGEEAAREAYIDQVIAEREGEEAAREAYIDQMIAEREAAAGW